MRRTLAQLIASLKSIPTERDGEPWVEFEATLGEIANLNDSDCIHPLLLLLNDDESFDELMFSIVHTVESSDDSVYVDAMIKSAPELLHRAPRWATILHMRTLNSDSARTAYSSLLRRATPQERAAAQTVLLRVSERRPAFADRVNAVLGSE